MKHLVNMHTNSLSDPWEAVYNLGVVIGGTLHRGRLANLNLAGLSGAASIDKSNENESVVLGTPRLVFHETGRVAGNAAGWAGIEVARRDLALRKGALGDVI